MNKNSLAHTKWNCKYHIVFTPKYRRQAIYGKIKKDKFCVILMGDTRIKGHIQPLGFEVMKVFEAEGFKLKEIIIKEQHNCKATGYWKTNSIKYNFFLIAHEYLFVFKK